MLAKDIMTRKLVTVTVAMTLKEAARTLLMARVSGAPVVDDSGRMVGVLSQTDIVREQARNEPRTLEIFSAQESSGLEAPSVSDGASPAATRVDQMMTPVVLSAQEDFTVERLAGMMLENHMHRVIVTRGGVPVGIVTPFDIIRGILPIRTA